MPFSVGLVFVFFFFVFFFLPAFVFIGPFVSIFFFFFLFVCFLKQGYFKQNRDTENRNVTTYQSNIISETKTLYFKQSRRY